MSPLSAAEAAADVLTNTHGVDSREHQGRNEAASNQAVRFFG